MTYYFFLEWKGKRPSKIEILQEKPKLITFECEFKSSHNKIIVCGNISDDDEYIPPFKKIYKKPQYLMSHLQKTIRRTEIMKSVQTAKHLIDLDPNSFIRRFPIILLEDVKIHSSISIVIWLMIAVSKKYKLKTFQIKWLLGVVYSVCENEDPVVDYGKLEGNVEWDEANISPEMNTLLWSLRFRQNYGGMKGDMKMIEDYIYKLKEGLIQVNSQKIPLINLDKVQSLQYKDWIYQANDFHCNRSIINQVISYYPKLSNDRCKELIWKYSSSENKRILKDIEEDKDWETIKKRVKYLQKQCIFY